MTANKHVYRNIFIVALMAIILASTYMTIGSRGNWSYILSLRGKKLAALTIVSICSTTATILFHTIAQNRILTPNIIGMDAIYIFFQTISLFLFGHSHRLLQNTYTNFFLSTVSMTCFSLLLYWFFFKKFPGRIYLLLMTGLILGTFFRSATSFLQVLIDPNEFLILQNRLFASFNNVDRSLISISMVIVLPVLIYIFHKNKAMDVLHLGRINAIGLGIDVDRLTLKLFISISLLVSVSTALVGPVMFLGFLGTNVSYKLFKTYQHWLLIIGGCLFTISFVLFGQILIEHVFKFQTTLSIILEFIGGSYFLFILLKEKEVA
ncbi:iron chelate uptake ABC transporter family permease subunit [Marinilactibacillus sp. Marseille-P9653]|uniref:iron chelate uptake ABC transporter family permease subunit n=1 Tax=Marinilactibacillus sp. Marseille-P9653 TaxID=2866583 RepID=UPI001CE40C3B|nr:iron chelate uptake ABC transporter family permease subunit [Marinilactibacillus sp. Marseille-P9653]